MSILNAILLGIVQGVTEFIPVSSSGHLAIVGRLVNLGDHFEFDVLLNLGTLAALSWYTRKQLLDIFKQITDGDYSLLFKLVVATLPAVVIGLALSESLERLNSSISLVAAMLVVIGAAMLVVKQRKHPLTSLNDISWKLALLVGCAQSLALIPGTSRAGITILAGLMLGMSRTLSARWSFLLAIPVIFGATAKVMLSRGGMQLLSQNFTAVLAGNIASFVVGLVAIGALMKILSSSSLKGFGIYRIILGSLLLGLVFADVL